MNGLSFPQLVLILNRLPQYDSKSGKLKKEGKKVPLELDAAINVLASVGGKTE